LATDRIENAQAMLRAVDLADDDARTIAWYFEFRRRQDP
jgi:hypothetical protein